MARMGSLDIFKVISSLIQNINFLYQYMQVVVKMIIVYRLPYYLLGTHIQLFNKTVPLEYQYESYC
ncbi:MAG: hypothetical protein CMJ20_07785 [Phycisphaeraceae bacterium]|nr:hypothetical protein [Phycisphaeraceae bacterium]